jgi:DNA-binding HxlR family transcriptional regulator
VAIDDRSPGKASLQQVTCKMQVKICYTRRVPKKKASPKRRSGCPLNASVEILGDRWSLLIIRDMMLRGFRTYKEFLGSYERIATNILADRLQKLIAHGIITTGRDASDGRKLIYSLTPKGIDLAPVLTEMVLWAAAHEDTANQALVREMRKDKEQFMSAIRQRWAQTTRAADGNASGKRKHSPDIRQPGRALRRSPSFRSQRLRDVDARGARRGQH